jgi:hypothetical protein
MLMGVHIVKGALEIEDVTCVLSEHYDERRVPHKEESVECGIDEVGNKACLFIGGTKIAERDLPSLIVAGYRIIVT